MTPWPKVLEQLSGRAFDSYRDALSEAQRLRGGPTTGNALLNAWKRYGYQGTPSERLVGGLWEGESTIRENIGEPDIETNRQQFSAGTDVLSPLHQKPPRPSIRIPAPDGLVAVLGDIHFPIHDTAALDAVFLLLADLSKRGLLGAIVLQGDTLDFVWASRFMTEAERIHRGAFLVDEVAAARPYLEALAELAPVHYIEGNHEGKRRDELVNENPWLYSHPAVDPASLLMLPEGIELYPWRSRIRFDCVTIEHGDKLKGSGSVYGVRNVLKNHCSGGESVHVYGHTHRLGSWRETSYDEEGLPVTRITANCGHLSDLRYHGYCSDSNWQTGLVMLCPLGGGAWDPQLVEVKHGRCSYGGQVYGS